MANATLFFGHRVIEIAMIKFDGQAVRLGAYRDDEHFKDIAITEDPDIKRMLLKELTNRRWQKLISD